MNARTSLTVVCIAGIVSSVGATAARGANFNIDWLSMAPTPFGSPPANNSNFNLPGVGTVNVTYSTPSGFTTARFDQTTQLGNGSVPYGPDTYQWGAYESFARTNNVSTPLNASWSITYTFPSTIPAGEIVLGVSGLGRRDPNPGESPLDCITRCSVSQNGTHFGDFANFGNFGPTSFSGGPGTFSMVNSMSGAGGADPWWNTPLAVVRIDDAIASLTVHFDHTAGDGVGVNIGHIVPAPGSATLMGAAGLLTLRRRRRGEESPGT